MATVEELTDAIEAGQSTLREAIAGAGSYWQERVLPPEAEEVNPRASGEPWTPREAADHAIGSLAFFAGMAAAGFEADLEAPAAPDVSSPAAALESLDRCVETCRAALEAASDGVLGRPTGLGDTQVNYAATRGQAIEKDVAGAFWMVALHSADHAQQIASGAGRA
jgi:hypothetical protein